METVVDALLITLGIDTKGVDKGMEAARGKITGGLKGIVSAMAAPVMAAFAGFSGAAAISAYTSTAAELDRLSQSLGMSMDELQGWQYAAEAAGAEAAEVGNFFRDMSDYIVDATTFDSGPLKDIAKELGITLKDARGNLRSTMDVTLDLADAFQRVGSQKAVAFGMQLGLDPGMIALLQKGRTEIEGLIKAQRELGGYTKEDAEIASKAQFAFMSLGRAMQAAAIPVARVLVPVMTVASEKISQAVALLRRHEPFVKAALVGVAAIITTMLLPASLKLAAAWLMNPMTWIIAVITAAVAALAIAVDDLYTYMTGGDSEFAEFWKQFGTGEEVAEKVQKKWKELKATWDSFVQALRSNLPVILRLVAVFGAFRIGAGVAGGVRSLGAAISAFGKQADDSGAKAAASVKKVGSLRRALNLLGKAVRANPLGLLLTIAGLVYDNWDKIVALFEKFEKLIDDVKKKLSGWKDEAAKSVKDVWKSMTSAEGRDDVASILEMGKATREVSMLAQRSSSGSVNASASTHVGTLNIYTNDADTANRMQNALLGAFDKQGKSQAQQIARAAQTGVEQK